MKKLLFKVLLVVIAVGFTNMAGIAQSKLTSKNVSIEISGTSTLHDWTMKGSGGICTADYSFDGTGKMTGIQNMTFSVPVNLLKSGKGAMDKNAYKALKTDKNPNIMAKFNLATILGTSNQNYNANTSLALTIAGKTLEVPLTANVKVTGNTITVTAEKSIDMKDWEVVPPSFMMGSVKTGKDVKVKVNFTLDNPIN
jgi:hypothetical protein